MIRSAVLLASFLLLSGSCTNAQDVSPETKQRVGDVTDADLGKVVLVYTALQDKYVAVAVQKAVIEDIRMLLQDRKADAPSVKTLQKLSSTAAHHMVFGIQTRADLLQKAETPEDKLFWSTRFKEIDTARLKSFNEHVHAARKAGWTLPK